MQKFVTSTLLQKRQVETVANKERRLQIMKQIISILVYYCRKEKN